MPVTIKNDPLPSTNPGERHVAAVLVVDTSGSMNGAPINELNQGLKEFGIALDGDSHARGCADVCVISFNSNVQTEQSFRPATSYEAPVLTANGLTAMNEAIETALDAIQARKDDYKANGISYYRPWLFLLTDGAPTDTDNESSARSRLQRAIGDQKVVFMPMAIGEDADVAKLQSYYPNDATAKPVLKATASNFKEAFVWLSNSLSQISRSDPATTKEIQTPPIPSNMTISVGI